MNEKKGARRRVPPACGLMFYFFAFFAGFLAAGFFFAGMTFFGSSLRAAWEAAKRAMGTRYGEHET